MAKEAETKELLVPVNAGYRQAVLNNVLLSRLVVFLIVVAIGTPIYYEANPKTIKEPVFIEFQSGENNFVKIAKAGDDLTANKALVDATIRRYILDREGVDKTTEDLRYKRVMAMSSDNIADSFITKYGADDAPFKTEGQIRKIIINRSGQLVKGVYQVSFTVKDSFGEADRSYLDDKEKATQSASGSSFRTAPPKTSQWVATVGFTFREQLVNYDERLMNPLGLIVTNYSLSKRN